jgi:hypothetical protein
VAHADAGVIHVPGDLLHGRRHVAGVQDDVVVLGLQQVGELLGEPPLVESLLDPVDVGQVEAAGEAVQTRDGASGHGHDRAAVHPAGEIGPHRDVRDELAPHRPLEKAGQLLDDALGVGEPWVHLGKARVEPAQRGLALGAGAHGERLAGAEDLDLAPERAVAVEILEGEVLDERLGVERGIQQPAGEDRLGLAREDQGSIDASVVERLDPEAVTGEGQRVGLPVVDGEGEHAVQAGKRRGPFLGPQRQQHLRVRPRREGVPAALQLGPQLPEVVDLAVVRHRAAGAGAGHGLVTTGRDVQHREAAVPEPHDGAAAVPFSGGAVQDGAVGVEVPEGLVHVMTAPTVGVEEGVPGVVGAAVSQRIAHPDDGRRADRPATEAHYSRDAAHGSSSPTPAACRFARRTS